MNAQQLVNRLLETEDIDWSPQPGDPDAPSPKQLKKLSDDLYPLTYEQLCQRTRNGEKYLEGIVEVPYAVWQAYAEGHDPDALNDYVSELVTGSEVALEDIGYKRTTRYRKPVDPDSVVIKFAASIANYLNDYYGPYGDAPDEP